MRRLNSALDWLNNAVEEQRAYQEGRPTSLQEAGRVGNNTPRAEVRPRAASVGDVDSAAEPTAEERTTRRPRRQAELVLTRAPHVSHRIRATLRNPASLRTAWLLREVLEPPVSRKPRRF